MVRVGEKFPLGFTPKPGPIRKILTHLGEPLEPPPVSPAHGPPTVWGELVQADDDRALFQGKSGTGPILLNALLA
jgi:hypothetical protein